MTPETSNITHHLEQIGAEDHDMMLCLIDIFNTQSPELLDNINQMREKKDPRETRNAAHTLKGVCLNLGFSPISTLCEEIEDAAGTRDFERINTLFQELCETHQSVTAKLKELSKKEH